MHKALYPNTKRKSQSKNIEDQKKQETKGFCSQFSIQCLDNILWPIVQTVALHFYRECQLVQFDMQNLHIQAYLLDRIVHCQEPIPK